MVTRCSEHSDTLATIQKQTMSHKIQIGISLATDVRAALEQASGKIVFSTQGKKDIFIDFYLLQTPSPVIIFKEGNEVILESNTKNGFTPLMAQQLPTRSIFLAKFSVAMIVRIFNERILETLTEDGTQVNFLIVGENRTTPPVHDEIESNADEIEMVFGPN